MAKKIWKRKIIERVYTSETGTRVFKKFLWERDKDAERNERRKLLEKIRKEKKRKAKRMPLVDRPPPKDSPRIILRKRKKE